MFYAERFPNPTRVSSPRQLPTDHVHAVSTRAYQSDQSSRQLLGCYRPCCSNPNARGEPPQRCSRYAARRKICVFARTVLTVKGPLRRAKTGRALDGCAPSRPRADCDGRLRRKHDSHTPRKNKSAVPLTERETADCLTLTCQLLEKLDKVAPYQKMNFSESCISRGLPNPLTRP